MRRLSPVTIAAMPVLLALIGNMATATVPIPKPGAPWIWGLTAILAVAVVANEVRRTRTDEQRTSANSDGLDDTVDQLAKAIQSQWTREEEYRKITDPVALVVRWHPAAEHLFDHWTNIRRASAGSDSGPIDLAGDLTEVVEVYKRVPSGRLVILGEAGTGKSVLAVRLTLGLLAARQPGEPVPVIVNIGSWNPTLTTLRHWMAEQLIRDYPQLARLHQDGRTIATTLVWDDLILAVLDGFDEMGPGLHRPALQQLNDISGTPLIITSRQAEYAAAVAGTDVLTAAAGIEIERLNLAEVAHYLPRTTRRSMVEDGRPTEIWEAILTRLRLRHDPAATHLRQALSTPLMIYLARTIYSDTPEHNPMELLDADRFSSTRAIEEHLISAYISAAYRQPSPTGGRWNRESAQDWLSFVAKQMRSLGTRDLAWWQLRDSVPRSVRMLMIGVLVTICGLLVGILWGELTGGLFFALYVGLFLGLATLGRTGPRPTSANLRRHRGMRRVIHLSIVMPAVVLVAMLPLVAVANLEGGSEVDAPNRVAPVLVVAIVVLSCIGVVLIIGPTFELEMPAVITAAAGPLETFVNDRRNAIRKGLTSGIGGGIVAGSFGALEDLVTGFRLGLTVGLLFALVFGFATTAWGHWLLARTFMSVSGRLPWSVHSFLADARYRGVLRQTGAVYQFRHARLYARLAESDIA